jgi:hypothetical protein
MIGSLRFSITRCVVSPGNIRIDDVIFVRATRITQLGHGLADGESRVSAVVDGRPLWFASKDIDLIPQPEAFASALMLSTIHRSRPLEMDERVSATWIRNMDRLFDIWSRWWGYRIPKAAFGVREDQQPSTSARALAFTCGVDSFFSLLTGRKPDFLVSVHGFDVPLADTVRMDAFASSVREIARETGTRSVVIRTNLRDHPASGRRRLWDRAHGGGLAAIGHLLSDHVREFTISSSYPRHERPWGSAGETDPLFSSDRISILHYGLEHSRDSKLPLIAGNALAQKHLRVCWRNSAEAGNCSRCDKCLATMLVLTEVDALEKFTVFDGPRVLRSRLDELPYLRNNMNVVQRIVNRGTLPRDIEIATLRLLRRSRRAAVIREYGNRLRAAIFPHA